MILTIKGQTYEKLFTLKEKKDEKYRNLSENAKLS